eukprot:CAMPEP_0115470456 /NCGR_PEP_ID=MMETSP0271-20121206/52013_1 /TAXON_ID=71861 /ORGANISM="Scrippsiella trochoidea, Strain CCMP3099" /LENGTH=145 /DNA_ID=CAMNT_0002897603 /DNA_START=217 /DNA_END=650 /DNA_ORIENTATION=-
MQPLLDQRQDGTCCVELGSPEASSLQRVDACHPQGVLGLQAVCAPPSSQDTKKTCVATRSQSSSWLSAESALQRSKLARSWISAVPKKLWRLAPASRTLLACKAATPRSHHGDGQEPPVACSAQYSLYALFVGRQAFSGDVVSTA